MRRLLLVVGIVVVITLFIGNALLPESLRPAATAVSSTTTHPPGPTRPPARDTATPSGATPLALPTALLTPVVTSPFRFPTRPPDLSPTLADDCTAVFPIENVERIEFGITTVPQLEAAFGRADYRGGRPTQLRFEEKGCALIVILGIQEALEAELVNYGSLGWLLDRYGPPAAVGLSQGNLTLLTIGNAVLLYPEQGVIAIFDAGPDELDRTTTVNHLHFRPPYAAEKQIARLNLHPVEDWQPPLR